MKSVCVCVRKREKWEALKKGLKEYDSFFYFYLSRVMWE